MISLLIQLLIIIVVFGLLYWVLLQIPLPQPFGRIAQVVLLVIGVLIIVLTLLSLIGVGPGVPLLIAR